MLLAAASLVPGLGSLAAAMDMALYLYEGDSFNAALAAAALIPGGAMLAIGVGKGARALFNLARAGAKDLGAAVKASRVFRGLAGGARAVSRVVGSVRTRISRLIGKTDDVGRDVGKFADDADSWRVPGSVKPTGVEHGTISNHLGMEGATGTFDDLTAAGTRGDRITPHHMPSDAYMKAKVPGYTRGEGITFNTRELTHFSTRTFGRSPFLGEAPRDALARDIWDLRSIFQREGRYTPYIRGGLQDVIRQNKIKFPGVFD
jgi:hypothetical protein